MGITSAALAAGFVRTRRPKYIFLMIGDGMGTAQRQAAERYARMKVPSRENALVMNRLPVMGMTTTTEVSGKVTDSAAAGTALACGVKTANGILCLTPDLLTPLKTVAEDARDAGMKVGIVTSVPVDHATPASFYAKVESRGSYYEIDEFLARSEMDYVAGEPMLGRKKAKDKTPPEQLAQSAGYQLVGDRAAFDALQPGCGKVLVEHDLGYAIEGPQAISLADLTRKGIELLQGDKGFFMMIEGGKIDWSGHANDLSTNIHETLAFNDAVAVALKFCEQHPDDSLLVVTADHETGGLELDAKTPQNLVSTIDTQTFIAGHYTDLVKQWKKTSVTPQQAYDRLIQAFGLTGLTKDEASHIRAAVEVTMSDDSEDARSPELQKMYGKKNMAVVSCLHQLAKRSGAHWTSFVHTDTKVTTTAWGRWARPFGGETDNTDIGQQLRALVAS
jgi:alkaline phosphatase